LRESLFTSRPFKKVKLDFNPTKSTAILITNKRKYDLPKINMDNIDIRIENSVKYLGITIDRKLSFNEHIRNFYNKCIDKIIKLPIVAQNVWGLKSDSLKLIYCAEIEPIVRTISYEAAIAIAGLTPIDYKIIEVINSSAIKNSDSVVIEVLICESLERKVSFTRKPHPAKVTQKLIFKTVIVM